MTKKYCLDCNFSYKNSCYVCELNLKSGKNKINKCTEACKYFEPKEDTDLEKVDWEEVLKGTITAVEFQKDGSFGIDFGDYSSDGSFVFIDTVIKKISIQTKVGDMLEEKPKNYEELREKFLTKAKQFVESYK